MAKEEEMRNRNPDRNNILNRDPTQRSTSAPTYRASWQAINKAATLEVLKELPVRHGVRCVVRNQTGGLFITQIYPSGRYRCTYTDPSNNLYGDGLCPHAYLLAKAYGDPDRIQVEV